ncbi:hypothetical protein BDB00DRAFT_869673 [Zychaea mexicana]|uniref:uncharacterized protein n=1 Tax=Zychaea mexicana TaxID=64656 RepID=UPI0022FEB447|nr:uncharacterized protein BDB00DRAFT_869673 [Zychaea mexicana]KAI9496076.1 hypothetical protein BDB00DRAFT_869673 [Zychaea mexicana]
MQNSSQLGQQQSQSIAMKQRLNDMEQKLDRLIPEDMYARKDMMAALRGAYCVLNRHDSTIDWTFSRTLTEEPNASIASKVISYVLNGADGRRNQWREPTLRRALAKSFVNKKDEVNAPQEVKAERLDERRKNMARPRLANRRRRWYQQHKNDPALTIYQEPESLFCAAFMSDDEGSDTMSRP